MNNRTKILIFYIVIGAFIGALILHPVNMFINWIEYYYLQGTAIPQPFLHLVVITIIFLVIGGIIGLGFGSYSNKVFLKNHTINSLTGEIKDRLGNLIAGGESDRVEFKSSIRWDYKKGNVNRELGDAFLKTIAAFMNAKGGYLIIGVNDKGQRLGLEKDYASLKTPNRDGFERLIIDLVKENLGGDICALVHFIFKESGGKDVCCLFITPAPRPVYLKIGKDPKFYTRAGNSSRELNIKEALNYIGQRWEK